MTERLSTTYKRTEFTAELCCSVHGCGKPKITRGFCKKHYARLLRHGSPTAGRTEEGVFLSWIMANANYQGDECLYYPQRDATKGPLVLKVDGQQFRATRYMCKTAHGAPPSPKHEAAHSCRHGHLSCLNPKHLRWATKIENEADKEIHGTRPRGRRSDWVPVI